MICFANGATNSVKSHKTAYDFFFKKIKVKRSALLSVGLAFVVLVAATGILYFLPAMSPIGFSVTSLKNGQEIQNTEIPLTIQGTYFSKGSGQVWVVLQGTDGQFYLQNPPVQFQSNGQWSAVNILPAHYITLVDFVYVTSEGNAVLHQKAVDKDFVPFSVLLDGSQILQGIRINTLQITASCNQRTVGKPFCLLTDLQSVSSVTLDTLRRA